MTDTDLDVAVHLAPSTTIGRYRIISKIGSGGMGDVYKAYDTQLERNVALKFIRPELLHDREKVWRFVQEARAASALSHPAIVTIYEIATAQQGNAEVQYIAMEYVEGVSLRSTFRDRPGLKKLLSIIVDVADGMAKAHAAGVVHRDLKPDNIMITTDGKPKIVDFGLAKLIQPELLAHARAPGQPDTMTLPHSNVGMVIGTAGYMSPEQVEGKAVDHRSDVFSLGCILYEAITGQNPFPGTSVVGVLHQILTAQPEPIADRNPDAPAALERIVRRCLAKDPDDRYQSIREVAIELRGLVDERAPVTPRVLAKHRRLTFAAAAVAALALAAIIVLVIHERLRPSELSNYRFTPFATDAVYEGFPAWSPDGKSIAYVAEVNGILQVFVRGLDSAQATQITHAVRDCREPFWDPRGNRVFYISLAQDRDSLWSVSVGGGEAGVLLQNVTTAAISPDRQMLATLRESEEQGNYALSLWISSPPEAPPRRYDRPPIVNARFASGYIRFSPDSTKFAIWTAERNLENLRGRGIWIVPRAGTPHRVLESLIPAPRPYPFSWMPDNRRLVLGAEYVLPGAGMHLWTADTESGVLRPLTRTGGTEYYPSVSPDGKRIVFSTEEDDFDLVRVSIDGSSVAPFLSTSRTEREPAWSPAADEYAYVTNPKGVPEIWIASGNGVWRRPVVTAKDFEREPTFLLANLSFSPDGQRIAYQRRGNHNYRIWISPIAGGPPVALTNDASHYEDQPTWSPDGNWVAYTASDDRRQNFRLAKVKPGTDSGPVLIKAGIVYPSNSQWSPRGDWITVDLPEGFAVVSPDGAQTRVLSEQSFVVHAWSHDGTAIYGIRLDDNLHLILTKIDVASARDTVVADLGASAPMIDPVNGLSLARDGRSFLTSMPHLKSDLWILDGFRRADESPLDRLLHSAL